MLGCKDSRNTDGCSLASHWPGTGQEGKIVKNNATAVSIMNELVREKTLLSETFSFTLFLYREIRFHDVESNVES